MTAELTAIRTEQIRSPSARSETGFVLKIGFHILFWSAFVIFGRQQPGKIAQIAESPFDVRFQDLSSVDQRTFRALQEGVSEAEAIRGKTGKWPSVESLAQQGVPPFAPDPIDKSGFVWRLIQETTLLDYIGTPAPGSGRKTFVAILIEPEPGTASDPRAVVDEMHHRLSDGTMIHASLYVGPGLAADTRPVAFVNPELGWRRITTVAAPY